MKEKKTLTFGPNDASSVIWARFHHHRSPLLFASCISILNPKDNKKISLVLKKNT
jgi:hypothetical protein